MAQQYPTNSTPMVYSYGTDDKSIKTPIYQEAARGIHVPLVYNWAEWGPVDEATLVHGASLNLIFGDETINGRGKYATHVTPFVNVFLANANSLLFERVLPRDHGPKASLRLFLEMVEDDLDEYQRGPDGFFKRDINDDLIPTGAKVRGYKIRYTVSEVPLDPVTHESTFGKGAIGTGSLTSSIGSPCEKIPLLDIEAPHYGEKGNQFGIRISAPTLRDINPMRDNILDKDNAYPFRFSLVRKSSPLTSAQIVSTRSGEPHDDFTLKPGLVDTDYNKDRYLGDMIVNNYQDLNGPIGTPLRFGPVGNAHIYQDNIDRVLKALLQVESTQSYVNNDLLGKGLDPKTEDHYRVNLFGLQQPSGIPYQCVRFDRGPTGVRLTESTDLLMRGAYDGTMTDAELAAIVEQKLELWGDPDTPYQDTIMYPCSLFWDSGFPLSTKFKMGKFVSQRKNTVVVISSYIAGERPLTTSEESARSLAIIERVRAYAESDYFATPTFRATVMSRSGKLLASTYRGRVPCTIELAAMTCRLAAGQSFRTQKRLDKSQNTIFTLLGDVSALWAPARVRNYDWGNGMMYPERLNTRQVYFPGLKTVYNDNTSVLNSFVAAIIIAECQTVGIYCQKKFSGSTDPKYILKANVEDYIREKLALRFAEMTVIEPVCEFTDADNHRGYSWTLTIRVGLPMMRTVETLIVEAYDIDYFQPGELAVVS